MGWARRVFEQKEIIVRPGQKIQTGVSCRPGKRAHGWLRVGDQNGSEFYKLPIENGQLHSTVIAVLERVKEQTAAGLMAKFFWVRTKNSVIWTDIGQAEREKAELSKYYDQILSEHEDDL